MKKMLFMLMVLLIASPAFAGVTITCNQPTPGNGRVDINYSVDDANLVRAFALNVQVSAGTISAVNNVNAKYRIYPGSIVISGGVVTNWGTPVASGTGALGGIGTSGVTLEMGSLYKMSDVNDANKPATSGLLCSITATAACTVTISGNPTRGNVVFESGATTDVSSNCAVTFPPPPTCWDASQCAGQPYGDANCDGYVNFADLARIKLAWLKNKGTTGYDCGSDFDHSNGVNFADLAILKVNWLHSPAYTPSTGNQVCPP